MKIRPIISLIATLILASHSAAQPAVQWIRTFGNGNYDSFSDVFTKADGGYLMCGHKTVIGQQGMSVETRSYIVAADADGNQQWETVLGDARAYEEAYSIIELDGGDIAVGGTKGTGGWSPTQAYVARLSPEGGVRWVTHYGDGTNCSALIELKEGPLILCGDYTANNERSGLLIKLSAEDGAAIWRRTYRNDQTNTFFTSMRETDEGVVVTGARYTANAQQIRIVIGKYDTAEGAETWFHAYENELSRESGPSICSTPGGFAVNSYAMNNDASRDSLCLRKINGNGEVQLLVQTDLDQDLARINKGWSGIARMGNNDLIQVGVARYDAGNARPFAQCITPNGDERWHTLYRMPELGNFADGLNFFLSVAPTRDGGAIACGQVMPRGNGQFDYQGFIMKIEPLRNEPLVFYQFPEDTMLECLIGDNIRFTVRASDQLRRDVTYLWKYDDADTISTDTTVAVTFNDFGDHIVSCQVSNGVGVSTVRWHIKVVDLLITAFTPDTLNLAVRRGVSVDFSIDTIRYSDGDPPQYLWTKRNLDNQQQEEAGVDAAATIPFIQSGSYRVEGLAYRGEASDAVVWRVTARGVIWNFFPEEQSLSVQVGEQIGFEVYPSNPDSGQIAYQWVRNGEVIGRQSALTARFDSAGDFKLLGIATEGIEADTVIWRINVTPLGVGNDKRSAYPTRTGIVSVTPNPFNSATKIRYSLMAAGDAKLSLLDIRGREIATLVNGQQAKGEHSITLDGASLPAGIYFARLEAGSDRMTVKVVMVR